MRPQRRLRNVQSISIRNISLAHAPAARRRTTTIDDDAVPHTLRSPAKMLALSETRALEHSRSSTDLRAAGEATAVPAPETDGSPPKRKDRRTPPRPSVRMRRRSTLDWSSATPQGRQERLEAVAGQRMADVFFSLHVARVQGRCVRAPAALRPPLS